MGKYPYLMNTGRLKSFIEMIPKMGVPPKVTQGNLPTFGFKSVNDRPIVLILKFIGFLNEQNEPTQIYRDFRDTSKSQSVMATALRKAYSELFDLYPDAHVKDDEALKNFFTPTTEAGEQVVMKTVATFKALCSFGDFKAVEGEGRKEGGEKGKEEGGEKAPPPMPTGVTINLNIQLTLPATDDASVYDKIFKALKDNLLSRD